jgi:HD-like signal output (HDOD) protein
MSTVISPDAIASAQRQIPPVAKVLSDLQRLLADTDTALEDIARLIKIDPALAARVVQIANSPHFRRGDACETIFDAVNRIGFREVYHVVAVVGSAAIVSQPVLTYRKDAIAMWRESLACAFASEMLAESCGEDPVAGYMSGLLHAIGRLAVNQHLVGSTAESGKIKQLNDDGFPRDFSGDEFAQFGFTQAEVAACMLTKWNFVASVVEPVRAQYEPLNAEEPFDRLAGVLYCGRFLRTLVCDGTEPEATDADDEVLELVGLTREDLIDYAPAVTEALTKAQSMG